MKPMYRTLSALRRVAAITLGLAAASLSAETFLINPHSNDNRLQNTGNVGFATHGTIRVGGDSGATDACGVFPFALPEIPEGEFILSVDFQFSMGKVANKPGPLDVYALAYRTVDPPTFTIDDYYAGAFDEDPNEAAIGLQPSILVIDSAPGAYQLNMTAREILRQFIIDQYDAGAQPGDYVTLRLSPNREDEGNYYYYDIHTTDNSDPALRPVLTIETFDGNYAPELADAPLQSVEVGQVLEFDIAGTDANEADVLTYSSDALPAFVEITNNGDSSATLTVTPLSGDAGLYTFPVTVSDGAKEGSGIVSIVVTDANAGGGVPSFNSVDPVVLNQGEGTTIDLTITDADSESVTLSVVNLPAFATFTDNGDKTASLAIDTWYDDPAGEYSIFVVAEDPDSNINVLEISLTLIEVSFAPGYYVDPAYGDKGNDGSPQHPWKTLQEVFALGHTFQPGDVIYLRDGYHGEPNINVPNDDTVYIKAAEGHSPTLSKLTFGSNATNWHVSGLDISRTHAETFSNSQMVNFNGSYNTVADCEIYSVPDTTGWEASDWLSSTSNGVGMSGHHNTLENCHIYNIAFGVSTGTSSSFLVIRGNKIQNFRGDGIRLLGNDQLAEYNYIADNYNVDNNHDDGIQGWSVDENGTSGGGVTSRNTIRKNFIIERTDPDRPLQGPLQGIGCFDGMFEEWVIENNVIIVNQWHGIALYGAINCKIINNTVLDQQLGASPGPTWITIEPHKRYTNTYDKYYLGTGNIVRNNLTTDIWSTLDNAPWATVDHNIEVRVTSIPQLDAIFVDYPTDLRLVAGTAAIDAGSEEDAPDVDFDDNPRPLGSATDIGAFEFIPPTWAGFPIGADDMAHTGSFLGSVHLGLKPWLWPASLDSWFYAEESFISAQGGWVFSVDMVPGSESGAFTWAGYMVSPNGVVDSPIGPLHVGESDWVYAFSLNTWIHLPEDRLSSLGAWLYVMDSGE